MVDAPSEAGYNDAMRSRPRTLEADDDEDVQRLYRERGWTDGLPVVAPTAARVEAMLAWSAFAPDRSSASNRSSSGP